MMNKYTKISKSNQFESKINVKLFFNYELSIEEKLLTNYF